MKYISVALVMLLFYACSDKSGVNVVTQFEQNAELKTATVQTLPVPVLLPRYMGITGEYLYVYKEKEENLFAFFHLPEASYMNDAGSRGQGPDEFNLLDTRSFRLTDEGFNVMEAGSNLYKSVVYDDEKLTVSHSERIFDQGISNNGFYLLANDMYVTLGRLDGNEEYCLLDRKTKKITKTGAYPEWTDNDRKPGDPPLFVTYLKSCVVQPGGKKFAAFYTRFKRIRIYDNSMQLLHDVDVQVPPCSTHFDEPIEKQPTYYIGQPYATADYIYALCANARPGNSNGYELQVWTWDGCPVACYHFDRKTSLMVISEKYNKIYTLNNKVDNEMYIYDLPVVKKKK